LYPIANIPLVPFPAALPFLLFETDEVVVVEEHVA
jgi:hypothetical protein